MTRFSTAPGTALKGDNSHSLLSHHYSAMSNRSLRVNALIQRELSDILRKCYQAEATPVTISAVDTAPDLRDSRVHVAVAGEPEAAREKLRWLQMIEPELRRELNRRIVLKYLPKFTFALDTVTARGNRILNILDELEQPRSTPS